MRRRFFAPPSAFAPDGSLVTLAPDEARHLRDVLRLGRGDEVFVFDGEGREYRSVVEECGRGVATLAISAEVAPARSESTLDLTLAVALLKGEKFDLVVQKATELGAQAIVPVITKHADVRVRDAADGAKRAVRLRRVALEACKQSGRARVPEISEPIAFDSLITRAFTHDEDLRWMFAERDGQSLIEMIKDSPAQRPPRAAFALIGSEGGWADEEIARARDAGWRILTLGGRTLRAETAAIAVTVLLQHLFGDLK